MFSLIRKELGLDDSSSSSRAIFPRGFDANQRVIARHAVRPDIEPDDPLAVSEAFGRGKWDKLARLSSSRELVHRRKVLEAYVREFQAEEESIVAALQPDEALGGGSNSGPALLERASTDPDAECRRLALQALRLAAKPLFPFCWLLEWGVVAVATKCTSDADAGVRLRAHALCLAIAMHHSDGVPQLTLSKYLSIAVLALNDEAEGEDVRAMALRALNECLSVRGTALNLLKLQCVETLNDLMLQRDSGVVVELAATCLHYMCFDEDAKAKATDVGCLQTLSKHLRIDKAPSELAAVCGAVMAITTYNPSKPLTLECDLLKSLTGTYRACATGKSTAAEFKNAIIPMLKTFCNLCEFPPCREYLAHEVRQAVKAMKSGLAKADEELRKEATHAETMIEWQP